MEEESNAELEFLDTLVKLNMESPLCLYIRCLSILSNAYTTALTTEQVVRKVSFPPCSLENIPFLPTKKT